MGLEVRAFGQMEIMHGGIAVRLRSHLQQVLLGVLIARHGGVVSVSRLAEALWPAASPASVGKSIQIHVHRLRRALRDSESVQRQASGYALAVHRARVDVYRFEDLAQRGRAALVRGDHAAAAELLQQALALNRGPAFPGLEDVAEVATESRRLAEQRLVALEDRIAAELALGEHAGLVSELTALVAEHPLRERFRAQLMTALYHVGRRADALAAYRAGRRILLQELGVAPNQECRAVERAILADDPALLARRRPAPAPATGAGPRVVVPRQLPADAPVFTGRESQLQQLDAALRSTGSGGPAACMIVAIDGTAGVGKTALAVHWGHRVRDRVPDGQLYVNLRGYPAGAPLAPIQALARFLRALGMPAEHIPADVDEAAAAYRSLLANRRMLVVLDDAAGAAQVRPLLPGGNGCVVVVTSRDRLVGLVAREGARRLSLDALPAGGARGFLEDHCGH